MVEYRQRYHIGRVRVISLSLKHCCYDRHIISASVCCHTMANPVSCPLNWTEGVEDQVNSRYSLSSLDGVLVVPLDSTGVLYL